MAPFASSIAAFFLILFAFPASPFAFPQNTNSGGCSTNFWVNHQEQWPSLVNIYTALTRVLGEIAYSIFGGPTTLLQAMQNPLSDPYSSLLREASTSLLNSYAHPDAFPYTPDAVRDSFQAALVNSTTAALQAAKFNSVNSVSYGSGGSCL